MIVILLIVLSLVSIAAITIVVAQRIQPVKIVLLNGHAMN